MMKIHVGTLTRHLGSRYSVDGIRHSHLQGYITDRAKEPGLRGRMIAASTIKKEIVTFRAIHTWAVQSELLPKSEFPSRGLRYPKETESPQFQTFDAVVRQTANLDPEDSEFQALWGTVFLSIAEVEELLDHVQQSASFPFVYPMFVFAAHNGARRSEIMRSLLVDIGSDVITIHERKRKKRQRTTRMVPISARLQEALDAWFEVKPQSPYTICHAGGLRSRLDAGEPITASHADKYFSKALADSKFRHVRGWHVFRHSFCSNCAAKGIDQRVIDGWVGHTTEEIRRR
jgi:site-specific recombinase XerD